jgi:hypothetical protein
VALLTLSAKYPALMRHVYDRLGTSLDLQGKAAVDLSAEVKRAAASTHDDCSAEDREEFVRDLSILPPDALLTREARPTFELVRSLSFVADLGQEPSGGQPPDGDAVRNRGPSPSTVTSPRRRAGTNALANDDPKQHRGKRT